MLLNKQGMQVTIPKQLNTREHPEVFEDLREIHEPATKGHGKMFNLETRCKFKE